MFFLGVITFELEMQKKTDQKAQKTQILAYCIFGDKVHRLVRRRIKNRML